MLNDFLYGPLGWKVTCAVLALVGILVTLAFMDGPWVRGNGPKQVLPGKGPDGPPQGSSSKRTLKHQKKSSRK